MCFRNRLALVGRQIQRVIVLSLVVGALLGAPSVVCATGVTLPDTGIDLSGLVNAALTALGTALTVIVGAFFSYLAVRIVMKWSHKMA